MKLLFLSYGIGPHQMEVEFAVRSLRIQDPDLSVDDVLVYTDTPDNFNKLAAKIKFIPSTQWDEWGGPKNFNHRRKILALDDALKHNECPVLLLDGDTWLIQSIKHIIPRIGPRRGVMHIREGQIRKVQSPMYEQLRDLLVSEKGQQTRIPLDAWMWNAGAIGLHPEQRPLLQEVLHLTDFLCEYSSMHVLEQLAFSFVLSQKIELQGVSDIVFHYWPPYLHKPFRLRLPEIMAQAASLPESEQAAFLYSRRPRPSIARRFKFVCKRILEALGLSDGYCRSNEW
jgi:hypothetical protein